MFVKSFFNPLEVFITFIRKSFSKVETNNFFSITNYMVNNPPYKIRKDIKYTKGN